MNATEIEIAAYFIVGAGYMFAGSFAKTPRWFVVPRIIMVIILWPGVVLGHIVARSGK